MSYRFTLAAVTAAITLTGCAKQQTSSEQPENYFQGPSQINVSHVVTRADDGSDIFLTIDGNNAGPLIAGQTNQVSVPPGKHQVGGYASTILGLGRVTIPPLEITTKSGEQTQIAYSVTRTKPVFVNEGVTKIPVQPKPVPEPVKQEAAPQPAQTAATVQAPPGDITSAAAANTAPGSAVTTSQPSSSDSSAETSGTEAVQRATGASATTQSTTVTTSQPAATDSSAVTSTTQAAQPSGNGTETTQSTTQPGTTTTETSSKAESSTQESGTTPPDSTQSTTDTAGTEASTAE